MHREWCLLLAVWTAGCAGPDSQVVSHSEEGPVIDAHLHAFTMGWASSIASVDSTWWPKDIPHPTDSDSLREQTIRALAEAGVVRAVASGDDLMTVGRYAEADSTVIIPALMIASGVNLDTLRAAHERGAIRVFGEAVWQYEGLSPADPRLDGLWSLAEDLDVPVGVHMGIAPPRWPELSSYRTNLGNPLQLEEVVARHPRARIWVMHAGWPFLDEMVGLLYSSPSVYVDVAVINWYLPRAEFHSYLRRLVEAGFTDRIMYGSDQMIWPASIPIGIEAIREAEFLTEAQKRAILCENAARFFRLEATLCRRN